MKLCPECKSDNIEKGYSIGLRVIGCIILLFFPAGLLYCWIPFVFPYKYICQVCGSEVKASDLIDIDWREQENILEQYRILEEKLSFFEDKWLKSNNNKVYKVVKAKGQFILLEFYNHNICPYRIIDFSIDNNINKFFINEKLTSKFYVLKHQTGEWLETNKNESDKEMPIDKLSSFGKQVITEEEYLKFESGLTTLIEWLEQNKKLIDNTEINL